MSTFLIPYALFLYGAAYNLQQILDGLGLNSSNFITINEAGFRNGSYWSPSEAALVPLSALILISLVLCFLLPICGYVIARTKGILAVLLLMFSPGFLSILGFIPNINYLPDSYGISEAGRLGSTIGYIPLLGMGVLVGWSLALIIVDLIGLQERFRQAFDHLWYLFALLTAVFFVYELNVSGSKSDYSEKDLLSKRAHSYLLEQVKDYDTLCRKNKMDLVSCDWASYIQPIINENMAYHHKVYISLGADTVKDYYSPKWSAIDTHVTDQIRSELMAYNDVMCPVTYISKNSQQYVKESHICQTTPAIYCNARSELNGKNVDVITRPLAIANECIVPMLLMNKKQMQKRSEQLKTVKVDYSYRWLFFILFSVVVGLKIANSTTKLFGFDKRESYDKRRSITAFLAPFKLIWLIFALLARLLNKCKIVASNVLKGALIHKKNHDKAQPPIE